MKKTKFKLLAISFAVMGLFLSSSCESDDDSSTEDQEVVGDDDDDDDDGDNGDGDTGTAVDETTLGFTEGNVVVQLVEIDGVDYYEVTTSNQTAIPAHQLGPWCAYDSEDDTAEEGGIWIDNESDEVYQVTYSFLDTTVNTLYADTDEDNALWDAIIDGDNINYTDTKEACEAAALPANEVLETSYSQCVECLPSFFEDENLENILYIPVTPVKLDTPQNINGTHGMSFNGVIFEGSAPVDDIVSVYTIAAFDNAGGHTNPFEGYHYHTSTSMTVGEEQADGHVDKIGLALDGFGLYDYNEELFASGELDDCQGHEDDERGYHYHVSSPGTNAFLPCFYGQAAETGGGGPPGMMQ